MPGYWDDHDRYNRPQTKGLKYMDKYVLTQEKSYERQGINWDGIEIQYARSTFKIKNAKEN